MIEFNVGDTFVYWNSDAPYTPYTIVSVYKTYINIEWLGDNGMVKDKTVSKNELIKDIKDGKYILTQRISIKLDEELFII